MTPTPVVPETAVFFLEGWCVEVALTCASVSSPRVVPDTAAFCRKLATSLHNYANVMESTARRLSSRHLRIVTILSGRVWSGGVTG